MKKKRILSQSNLFADPVEYDNDPFAARALNTDDRGILALDIATCTGWCVFDKSGIWDFTPKKGDAEGLRLIRFKTQLDKISIDRKIKVVVYERPAIQGKFPNFVGMEMLGIMKVFCAEHGIPFTGVPPATLQKFATGVGKGNKPLMIEMCRKKYGIEPATDDEADAVHLYHYAIEKLKL